MKTTGMELHKEQIRVINNGVTAFIVLVNENQQELNPHSKQINSFIEMFSPLQIGQKLFIQEDTEEVFSHGMSPYGIEIKSKVKRPASQMTYRQSIIKDLTTATIKVKRVQDIKNEMMQNLSSVRWTDFSKMDFIAWFNDIHGEESYKSNPYVFIYTFKKDNT